MSSLELQRALVPHLRASPVVASLVSNRILDAPPAGTPYPYLSIGPDNTLPSRADCYDGQVISFQLDGWSNQPGFTEVKRIQDAVVEALNDASLSLMGYRLVDLYLDQSRTLRDSTDGVSHVAMIFRAIVEPI